jgi:hypothetical protein
VGEESDDLVNSLLVASVNYSRELTEFLLICGPASDDASNCTTYLVSERELLTNQIILLEAVAVRIVPT